MGKSNTIRRSGPWLVSTAAFVGILLIGVTTLVLTNKPAANSQTEARDLQDRVGQLVTLPKNEDPAIATVTASTNISDPFMKQAKEGDKLLLYYKSLKAYLYRPSINKIVDIGPITVDPSTAEVAGTRIVVKGRATDDERANNYRARLMSLYKSAVVLSAQDNGSGAPADTIVVDLTNDNKKYNLVSNIAATLDIKRGTLPLGETAPADADILILVGQK